MIANIVVEIPYQIITGILIWACFYYPVVGIQSSERQALVLLFCIVFFIYASIRSKSDALIGASSAMS